MSHQQVKQEDAETQLETLPPPSMVSNWCQTQNQIAKLDFERTIQRLAFLVAFKHWGNYSSSVFFHEKADGSKYSLNLHDIGSGIQIDLAMVCLDQILGNPVRVQIAISNKKREKIFSHQHCLPQHTRLPYRIFNIEKKMLVESECFVNENLTIYCEIEQFISNIPVNLSGKLLSVANCLEKPFSSNDQLVAQLEELFENMKFPDITINVRGRQFKAHKSILATRSQFFAAMFDHPTKENLTNQVEVEDVEPAVFNEVLRFIYTGRLSESTMGKMTIDILAVADKYLLDQLKMECEIHINNRMSAENCLKLLLVTDEHHPAFHLKKYADEFFRRFSGEVMETDDWRKGEQNHPEQFVSMLKKIVKSPVESDLPPVV